MAMASAQDDREHDLIAAAQQGERRAWETLVQRHDRWVRAIVYTTLGSSSHVDDVLQQIWMQVWQQLSTLVERDKWRSWLYRLARNAAIDAGQAAARRRKLHRPLADGEESPTEQASVLPRLAAAEERRRILDAIQALPAIYREPFVLRHLEDWNYEQIGRTLDLPVDTVETRLVRARRLLREALRGNSHSE